MTKGFLPTNVKAYGEADKNDVGTAEERFTELISREYQKKYGPHIEIFPNQLPKRIIPSRLNSTGPQLIKRFQGGLEAVVGIKDNVFSAVLVVENPKQFALFNYLRT